MKNKYYCIFLCSLGLLFTGSLVIKQMNYKAPVILKSYEITSNENLIPYSSSQEVVEYIVAEPEVEIIDPGTYPEDGVSWLIGLTNEGSPAMQSDTYEIVYNSEGEQISRILVPHLSVVKEAEPVTYSYGVEPDIGTYFLTQKTTTYGADCVGCGGEITGFAGTSVGIQTSITSVRQSDGTWKDGITYDGYYLIATDSSIPLCTVVEISDHGWSGQGMTPSEPFLAIVADRGGAVKTNIVDLFGGTEKGYTGITNSKRVGVRVEIVEFGIRTRNDLGELMCKVG